MTDRTEASHSDPFVRAGSGQLLQGAAVSLLMPSTHSEVLSIGLGHNSGRNRLLVSAEEDADGLLDIIAESGDLLLWLLTKRCSRKLWTEAIGKDDILKPMTASVKHLENKLRSIEIEK